MTGRNVIRDLFLLSYRKIRCSYPVSPQQCYSFKRIFTGSKAVKEIPARRPVRRKEVSSGTSMEIFVTLTGLLTTA